MNKPLISVIIPTRNNSILLEQALISLSNQKFKSFETIIVDGNSSDRTQEIAKKYNTTLIQETHHTRGGACNDGAKIASGDILVFTDDDCTFPTDWLEKINTAFKSGIDIYGGNDIVKKGTLFEKALFQIDIANDKKPKPAEKRLRGCNTSYRKSIFMKEKFNPKLTGIEETELHSRLLSHTEKIKFDQNHIIYHTRRKSFRALFKRLYTNGKSRARLIKLKKSLREPMDIIAPLGIILTMLALLAYFINPPITTVWLTLILLYILAKPAIITIRSRGLRYYPILVPIVLTRELAFGLGALHFLVAKK